MRRALASAGVSQPRLACCQPEPTSRSSRALTGLPCVVKPLRLSGSRGVIRADDAEQARSTDRARPQNCRRRWGVARRAAAAGELTAGTEVAVEGLLRGGRLVVLAVFDKPDPLEGPYFEETLYVTPSRLATAVRAEVEAIAARAARTLGLREGPSHAELRVDGERVSVLELAAVDRRAVLARAALRRRRQPGAGDLGPRAGTRTRGPGAGVEGVWRNDDPDPRGWRAARGRGAAAGARGGRHRRAGDHDRHRGRHVVPLPDGNRYLGFMFARATSAGEVEHSLRAANARLRIRIEPHAPEPVGIR